MGYPSLKLYLSDLFMSSLAAVQDNPTDLIKEIFEEPSWDNSRRCEIVNYLNGLEITDNLQERDEDKNYLYILPHFPRLDASFPQIAISTGNEGTAGRGLGDATGCSTEVLNESEEIVAYKHEYGYFATGQWNVDIVCKNPIEAEYLSILCRHVILDNLDSFATMGVLEIDLSLADLALGPDVQPVDMFARRLTMSAKVAHTWYKQIAPLGEYKTGINTAL